MLGRAGGVLMCGLFGLGAARAQAPTDELLRWGTLATLAPLCGVRDETWAFDLRRAELQSAIGSKRFDDPALKSAPGSDAAMAALSYAEAEALEDFAETSPERTCVPLANSPDLGRGDEIVRAFRAQRGLQSGS
jgi:hypothetical protein